MNRKGDAGIKLTGGEVAKLLVAVISILILIYLGYTIFQSYFEQNETQKGKAELEEVLLTLAKADSDNEQKDYFVLYAPQWYLFSSEFPDLCEGPYCLCLCIDKKCEDANARACIATDKFVSIKNKGRENRLVQIQEPPSKLVLSVSDESVYPFNSGESVRNNWGVATQITPLYYKFETEWLWSPDLENWMDTETLQARGEKWRGIKISDKNKDFISNFLTPIKDSKEKGEELFDNLDGSLSEGVYIIEL